MTIQTFHMHLYLAEDYDESYERVQKFKLLPWAKEHNRESVFGAYVGPVTVEAEVPDDFDLRAAKLKAKQDELQAVRAEFTRRITEIQRQISELQAIAYEAEVTELKAA